MRDMLDWAKEEIRIAIEKEDGYGKACYESALKAYKCLCEDEHSGLSWALTTQILNQLCKGFPLSPIENTPDVWEEVSELPGGKTLYQCKRRPSLFKDIDKKGNETFSDVERVKCVDPKTDTVFAFSLATHMIDDMFPIEFPYLPIDKYKVAVVSFKADDPECDLDTIGISTILTPDKEVIQVNRFFRKPDDREDPTFNGWVEIDIDEFIKRYAGRVK